MIWFLGTFGVLWIAGWVLMFFSTSASQEPTLWEKVKSAFILFFLWPLVCWEMANHGDV